jgi:cytoskeletal protein CcmA (bactofilin family)
VDGKVEGPNSRWRVVLKSQAQVVGDIRHQCLAIEKGASFEGRSIQVRGANEQQPERVGRRSLREIVRKDSEVVSHGSKEAD